MDLHYGSKGLKLTHDDSTIFFNKQYKAIIDIP